MSLSVSKDLSCSFSTTPATVPLKQQKPSEKLERIRSNLLKSSDVVTELPILVTDHVCQIINDYLGHHKAQEAQIAKSFRSCFSEIESAECIVKLLAGSTVLTILSERLPNSMQKKVFLSFISNTKNAILADPFFLDLSIMEASTDYQQNLLFQSKCIKAAILTAENLSDEFCSEQFLPWLAEVISDLQKTPISFLYEHNHQKERMLTADRAHIDLWIREIVTIQKTFISALGIPVLEEGNSQGYTFTIKKADQLYGYLFGTIHNFISIPYGKKVSELTTDIQKRLYECAILGTEIPMNPKKYRIDEGSSVEASLILCASQRGIANIAIDDSEDFDRSESEAIGSIQDEIGERYAGSAYIAGDLEKMKDYFGAPDPEFKSLLQRNIAMAENIDALLIGCDKVQRTMDSSPIKCFLAVGIGHFLSSEFVPDSVVELLQKKGWTIERLP